MTARPMGCLEGMEQHLLYSGELRFVIAASAGGGLGYLRTLTKICTRDAGIRMCTGRNCYKLCEWSEYPQIDWLTPPTSLD
jgi:hypothetical protein